MIKNNVCNNCGKQGHLFHQCKLPITSYGIILFKSSDQDQGQGPKYLMIRRKDSFGYIDLLRGKYIQQGERMTVPYPPAKVLCRPLIWNSIYIFDIYIRLDIRLYISISALKKTYTIKYIMIKNIIIN